MNRIDIAVLGASKVVDGVPVWQANVPVANDVDDVEPFGEIDAIQSLGHTALPYPADSTGHAEGLFATGVAGRDAVCFGARDTRNAGLVGKMKPGDTTLHSTGPGSVAQCFLKHEKKQAGLATEDADGKTMLFMLDGKNKKAQLAARGAMIEIGKDGSITFTAKGGASIKLDDKIYLLGPLSLSGMTPGFALMQGPATGSPGGGGAVPMTPVMSVGK
jgi:hypothetical protein